MLSPICTHCNIILQRDGKFVISQFAGTNARMHNRFLAVCSFCKLARLLSAVLPRCKTLP